MPVFEYRAKLGPEQVLEGTIEAADERNASLQLTRQGYFLISLAPQKVKATTARLPRLGRRVGSGDVQTFTGQLADLIDAGLPIYRALGVIAGQTPNAHFRKIIATIGENVKDGTSLSSSLGTHPELFSKLYIGMVQSGEQSGTLGHVLKRLTSHLEQSEELKRNIKSALIYPSFVFGVGIVSIVVLLTVVIPRLVGLFEEMGQALPLPTRMILAMSAFFVDFWWLVALVVLGLALLYTRRQSIKFIGRTVDYLKLHIPVEKDLHIKRELSEYTRTLSTLLQQKVSMISALQISLNTIENSIIKKRMQGVSELVANGEKPHVALAQAGFLSPVALNMVSVGEEGGKLADALGKVADTYQTDITTTTKRLTALLEPAIILVLAIGLGFIILAIILPILQLEVFEF